MRKIVPVSFLILVGASLGFAHAGGSLRATDSMDVERAAHTMTTLPDGRVLVVGGFGARGGQANQPLLFDPTTMQFGLLQVELEERHSHSATRLADGTVLLAGGYGPSNNYLDTAELFDPRTGTTRAVGRLAEARGGHTAVLLADGRILIAGGVGDGWTFLASAELYDPAVSRFVSAGSMNSARESHVATRLPDGRVLISGGHAGSRRALRVLDTAEIYDPVSGQFTNTSPLTVRRHKHDAVLLENGKVLILGGADERDSRGVYRSTELFDPRVERFVGHVPMRLPRYKLAGSSVTLNDGRILITGGAERPEIYEPGEKQFHAVSTSEVMPGLFSSTAALDDGRVLISGGYGGPGRATSSAWVFESN